MKKKKYFFIYSLFFYIIWKLIKYNDWSPTIKDLEVIRQRIQEKIEMKPNWYK
jgi:hypothetical protein